MEKEKCKHLVRRWTHKEDMNNTRCEQLKVCTIGKYAL
jgi:hypothetical protein